MLRLRSLFPQSLGFLAIASLFSLAFFPSALAFPVDQVMETPKGIAQLHCQLLHYTGTKESGKFNLIQLKKMAGTEAVYSQLTEDTFKPLVTDFGTAPDFGFVLGKRWEAYTKEDRRKINELFTGRVQQEYNLPHDGAPAKRCGMQLLELSENSTASTEKESVYLRTSLQGTVAGQEPSSIIYRVERRPNENWRIADIIIDGQSMIQRDRLALSAHISQNGVSNATNYFGAVRQWNEVHPPVAAAHEGAPDASQNTQPQNVQPETMQEVPQEVQEVPQDSTSQNP